MIFSDRDLHKLIDSGRLAIDPFDPESIQPSSIDLRVGRQFRVFANSRYPYIDVRQPMDELTELVEANEEEPFILHPGEFVLAATLERVSLPDDVVGRLEGKSSLGRLGLLIHSSLPGSEPVLIRTVGGSPRWMPIEDVVRKRLAADVVSFDPESLEVGYHPITGWYEGPPDKIYEVVLESGRSVRVTAGHNLFAGDGEGGITKVRTAALAAGTDVAVSTGTPGEIEPAVHDREAAVIGAPRGHPVAQPGSLLRSRVEFDLVRAVRDPGEVETIFDLEVRPGGRKIENFLAGSGGVFVSNTAGFVDPGFEGYLTLELSNVANLPITIYPGMKIGQISLFQMTSAAEFPYGSKELGSKYLGQEGPTPSRYYENFDDR